MREFKGTPGNWSVDKTSRAVGPVSKEDDQSYGMVIPVAWVEFDPEVETQHANQKIIAAAPELLEALQNMINRIEYYANLDDSQKPSIEDWAYTYNSSDMDSARKALAKALGEN